MHGWRCEGERGGGGGEKRWKGRGLLLDLHKERWSARWLQVGHVTQANEKLARYADSASLVVRERGGLG